MDRRLPLDSGRGVSTRGHKERIKVKWKEYWIVRRVREKSRYRGSIGKITRRIRGSGPWPCVCLVTGDNIDESDNARGVLAEFCSRRFWFEIW
jgi:hypothetical protein